MCSIISNVYKNTHKQRKKKENRPNSEALENCHNASDKS